MDDDILYLIDRLVEASNTYARDDFCDGNPANREAYDLLWNTISRLDALVRDGHYTNAI